MRLKSILLYLFIFIVLGAHSVYAVEPSAISINIAPPNPVPYANVTITLSSFLANLDSVTITWLVDGKIILSGIGKKSFSITTKAANSETKIEAKIFLPDGEINKNITIRPSVMVLLWQANDSYSPPFYKGKVLPSPSSEVKVVAMPEVKTNTGLTASSTNMTYVWKKDYTNQPADSGYGKNFFTFVNDYLEDSNNISVVASTIDNKYSFGTNIEIETIEPKILFYKNDNNLGTLWEQTLSDNHIVNNEETIVAAPYFISPKQIQNPILMWNWSINGNAISGLNYRKNFMPLKVQTGTSGTSKLNLEIENTYKIFQTAKKEINLNF